MVGRKFYLTRAVKSCEKCFLYNQEAMNTKDQNHYEALKLRDLANAEANKALENPHESIKPIFIRTLLKECSECKYVEPRIKNLVENTEERKIIGSWTGRGDKFDEFEKKIRKFEEMLDK